MSTLNAPRDLIAESKERFTREVADHEMKVLRDDGLYRHLRFKAPQTMSYYFDIVTWPGYLAIVGDCGNFVFCRIREMFEFFESSHGAINPGYWSEKLQAPSPDAAMRYSHDAFLARVLEWFEYASEDLTREESAALRSALDEQVLADWLDAAHSEHEAYRLLNEFDHDGRRIYDAWEWSLREYDWKFLWCCHAIVWGIARYRAANSHERSEDA